MISTFLFIYLIIFSTVNPLKSISAGLSGAATKIGWTTGVEILLNRWLKLNGPNNTKSDQIETTTMKTEPFVDGMIESTTFQWETTSTTIWPTITSRTGEWEQMRECGVPSGPLS